MDAVIRSGRITRWNPRRRQVRRRTYASAHACDEGKVYRGPPPQLPLRCGCPPKHLAPLELPPPWAPLPFVREYPRIVAAECVDKRRTRAGRRKEFSLGEDRNPIEPRPLASLVVPSTRWIMRGLCMEWYNGREREKEREIGCRRARFHFREPEIIGEIEGSEPAHYPKPLLSVAAREHAETRRGKGG